MPGIKVTWEDGVNKPFVWNISAEVVEALDSYRQQITAPNPLTMVSTPIYPSVREFIVGILAQYGVTPALDRKPTKEIEAAQKDVANAQAVLATIKAATLVSAVQPE